MKYWLEIIGDTLLIVFGVMSVMVFAGIMIQGKVILVEPVSWIVITEIIVGIGIAGLGAWHLHKDW